jgi:hypothetical protein
MVWGTVLAHQVAPPVNIRISQQIFRLSQAYSGQAKQFPPTMLIIRSILFSVLCGLAMGDPAQQVFHLPIVAKVVWVCVLVRAM